MSMLEEVFYTPTIVFQGVRESRTEEQRTYIDQYHWISQILRKHAELTAQSAQTGWFRYNHESVRDILQSRQKLGLASEIVRSKQPCPLDHGHVCFAQG